MQRKNMAQRASVWLRYKTPSNQVGRASLMRSLSSFIVSAWFAQILLRRAIGELYKLGIIRRAVETVSPEVTDMIRKHPCDRLLPSRVLISESDRKSVV